MNNASRRFASLLTVILVLAMIALSACGTTGTTTAVTTNAAATTAKPTTVATTAAAPLEITWVIAGDQTAYVDDNIVVKQLNAKFNVKLTTLKINAMDAEKLNVTLAGGQIPDVLVKWGCSDFYKNGVIRSITKEMIQKNMPATFAKINELGGNAAWTMFTDASDNKLIAIPQIAVNGTAKLGSSIRKDWLENVGITKMPATLDELHDVLVKFTFNDPDKNGKDDTYGMGAAGLHPNPLFAHFPYVWGAFGVHPQQWHEVSGKIAYDGISTGARDALKVLAAWYKEGLIDKEFVTTQNADYGNKTINGVFGVNDCHPSYLDPTSPTSTNAQLKAKSPNAELVMFAPVKGPSGKSGTITYGVVGSWGLMFGAKTSDEKVAKAMQIAEALNTDNDLFKLTFFGVEGTTCEKIAGTPTFTITKGVVEAANGVKTFRTGSYLNWDAVAMYTTPKGLDLLKSTVNYPLISSAVNDGHVLSMSGLSSRADADKVQLEYYFNAITGKVAIDTTWDKYVSDWLAAGGSKLTDGANKAPRLDK